MGAEFTICTILHHRVLYIPTCRESYMAPPTSRRKTYDFLIYVDKSDNFGIPVITRTIVKTIKKTINNTIKKHHFYYFSVRKNICLST